MKSRMLDPQAVLHDALDNARTRGEALPGLQAALYRLGEAFACDLSGTPQAEESGEARCPALPVESLGDPSFRLDHRLAYNYLAGAMANGIASVELVAAMAFVGMLGIFGAAGLGLPQLEAALHRLKGELRDLPFGVNLIHSPQEPRHEAAVADVLMRENIRLVEASAYLDLTLPLVKYRLAGIKQAPDGTIHTPNRVIGKVSRVEVASKFMSPPPPAMVRELVRVGVLTTQQGEWAKHVPVAEDITAEADSAGHTDNRPALTLLPTLLALRDRLQARFEYDRPLRVGAAGGLATPTAVAAAFTLGAAYVVTGTINQACVESGTSDAVRQLLAQAEQADTCMAPAADMFEMGVKVQVLKRGTLFPMRAAKLYELYRHYDSWEAIPASDRNQVERTHFRASFDHVWDQTQRFFQQRDPEQITLARQDPKHKLALVFRWYLGQSSKWANQGLADRRADYQVWCGPAMGAFNEWTRGTFLEKPEERKVATVGLNLMYHAAVHLRAAHLRLQGVRLPTCVPQLRPLPLQCLREQLGLAEGG